MSPAFHWRVNSVFSSETAEEVFPDFLENVKTLLQSLPYSPSIKSFKEFMECALIDGYQKYIFIYVLNSDEFVGFLQGRVIFESADLDYIAVAPACLSNGIGSDLLTLFENLCREQGAGRILLEVSERNISALNLYNRFQFKAVSRRKKYYFGTEDAVIMEKIL